MIFGDSGDRWTDPSLFREVFDLSPLSLAHHRNDHALCAGSGGTARSMQIRLVVDWWVEVHDKIDVVNVNAAGRHISCHHDGATTGPEELEVANSNVLTEIAVHFYRWNSTHHELLR